MILDGVKGLRAAVRKAFRERALVHRCQWHKRENVVSYLAKSEQASWRQRLQRAYNRPAYDEALAALKRRSLRELDRRPEPICRRQSEGRAGRDPDAASGLGPYAGAGPVAEERRQLSRVHQCARRGSLCEGRDTGRTRANASAGVATVALLDIEHALAEGDGLPPPTHAPYRAEATTERIDTATSKKKAA